VRSWLTPKINFEMPLAVHETGKRLTTQTSG
jgi:hypothetical protein